MCRNYLRCDVGRENITKTSNFHSLFNHTKSGFLISEERIDRFKNIHIQICKFSRKKLILLMRAGRWLYRPARECRLVGGGAG